MCILVQFSPKWPPYRLMPSFKFMHEDVLSVNDVSAAVTCGKTRDYEYLATQASELTGDVGMSDCRIWYVSCQVYVYID